MPNVKKRKIFIPIVMASLVTTLGVGTISYPRETKASSGTTISAPYNHTGNRYGFGRGKGQGAGGIVTAISGPMLTITGKNNAIYAIDASDATLLRMSTLGTNHGIKVPGIPTAISLSDIKVGDRVMVRGEISGTPIKTITVSNARTKRTIDPEKVIKEVREKYK